VFTLESIPDESVTMALRKQVARVFVALGCATGFAIAPVVTASPAGACPPSFYSDPFTNQCAAPGSGIPTVNGIPCIPGEHLGTCLGMLQNMPGGYNPWP
jgi:hypothetical protein